MDKRKEYEQIILRGLINTEVSLRADYAKHLEESFFSTDRDRKIFKLLIQGEEDITKIAKEAGVDLTYLTNLITEYGVITPTIVSDFRDMVYASLAKKAIDTGDWAEIRRLSTNVVIREDKDIMKEFEEYREGMVSNLSNNLFGMSTGIEILNNATGGFIPGHIWICGGYRGYGKTFFAINTINEVLNQDKRVVFFSLEMFAAEIVHRLISLRTGLSYKDSLLPPTPEDTDKVEKEKAFIEEKIRTRKLVIEEDARTSDYLLSKLISEESVEHVDFTVVDYIQQLTEGDMYDSLRDITKSIQGITKEIKTCTLLLSQINNESQKEGTNSRVDGFKGAGEIGQIANVAIKIERRVDEDGKLEDFFGLNVLKIRHGEPCKLACRILFPGGRITNAEPETIIGEEADNQFFGL